MEQNKIKRGKNLSVNLALWLSSNSTCLKGLPSASLSCNWKMSTESLHFPFLLLVTREHNYKLKCIKETVTLASNFQQQRYLQVLHCSLDLVYLHLIAQ